MEVIAFATTLHMRSIVCSQEFVRIVTMSMPGRRK